MTIALLSRSDTVERLAREYGERGWRLAVSLMGNASDADDVMQQAYIIAASKADSIPEDHCWSWFAAVITNVSRNARRARGRSSNRFRALEGDAHEDYRAHDPAEECESAELCERLRGELEALPDAEREAVVLTHISGLTHQMAASALNVPLGTLKSHVRRGVERLRVRMSLSDAAIAGAFCLVPIEMPAGGLDNALAQWVSSARAVADSSSSGSAAIASKAGWNRLGSLSGTVVALLIGVGTGCLFTVGVGSMLSSPTTSQASDKSNTVASSAARANSGVVVGQHAREGEVTRRRGVDSRNANRRTQGGMEDAAPVATSTDRANKGDTASQQDQAAEPTEVNKSSDEASSVSLNLPIPYEGWNKYSALGTIEWDGLATGMNAYQALLEEVYRLRSEGKEVSEDLKARLSFAGAEMERERFRALTRVYDGLPTSTRDGNGEWTHPAVSSNLMATRLKHAGVALSADQVSAIVGFAAEYDASWEEFQANSEGRSRIETLAGELKLKEQFNQNVSGILTFGQANALASEHTRGIAGLDSQAPANMIPVNPNHNGIVATSNDQARRLLMDRVAADLGLPRSELNGYEHVFDQWVNETQATAGTPGSPPGTVSTNALIQSTEAQNRAYRTLTELAPHNTQLNQALNNSGTVFVPQVVPPKVLIPAATQPSGTPNLDSDTRPNADTNPDGTPHSSSRDYVEGEEPIEEFPEGADGTGPDGEIVEDPSVTESSQSSSGGAKTNDKATTTDGKTTIVVAGLYKVEVSNREAQHIHPDDSQEVWRYLIEDKNFVAPTEPSPDGTSK